MGLSAPHWRRYMDGLKSRACNRISRGARRFTHERHCLEQHSFGAEVGRLLDLVVHSLYSEREIFLRELVANAADAVDRRRFEALTNSNLAPPPDAKIQIVPDKKANTLTIADNGIGMSHDELIENLRHHRPIRHRQFRQEPVGRFEDGQA